MGRLDTDRTDWTYIVECSVHGEDHVRLTAEASNAKPDPEECFPFDDCPACGAALSIIKQQEPATVLD